MEKSRPGACRGGAFYTLDGQGQTRFPAAKSQRWTSSSSSVGASPPSSSSSPTLIFARWKVRRSFSGAEIVSGEADEAGGPSPVNEENEAGRGFRPEKPYLPLSIEGSIFGKQTMRFAMAKPVFSRKSMLPVLFSEQSLANSGQPRRRAQSCPASSSRAPLPGCPAAPLPARPGCVPAAGGEPTPPKRADHPAPPGAASWQVSLIPSRSRGCRPRRSGSGGGGRGTFSHPPGR